MRLRNTIENFYHLKNLGKVVYHTGSWAGNQSYIKRYIDQKSVIVLLNNTHSPYMKEVRSILDDYLEGKPLRRPRVRAVEQLKRDICNLNLHNLKEWKLEHPGMIWDTVQLKQLLTFYDSYGDENKKAIILSFWNVKS